MWIVIQRGRYYSEMDGDIYALLCRQYAEDGRPGPVKVGEADTYQGAKDLARKLQQEKRKEAEHANDREVDGCEVGGDIKEGVDPDDGKVEAGVRNEEGVPGGGCGEADWNSAGIVAVPEEGDAVEGSRLDAQSQGLLPVPWAQDDILAGVRGEEDRLPVFTGERYCRAHPREARIMLQLRFVYGFPIREVSKILGCSPQTVSNVCKREVTSKTAKEFREAMASRLRNTVSDLLEQVQERVLNDEEMKNTSLKDVVAALEKAGNMLQQMETSVAPGSAKDADPEHAKEMEQMAQDYLVRLRTVEPVDVTVEAFEKDEV